MTLRELPRNVLREFVGAPFKLTGRSLTDGVDCLGLVILWYARHGIVLPDCVITPGMDVLDEFASLWQPVAVDDPWHYGDLVETTHVESQTVRRRHISVCVGHGSVLTTGATTRAVVAPERSFRRLHPVGVHRLRPGAR